MWCGSGDGWEGRERVVSGAVSQTLASPQVRENTGCFSKRERWIYKKKNLKEIIIIRTIYRKEI